MRISWRKVNSSLYKGTLDLLQYLVWSGLAGSACGKNLLVEGTYPAWPMTINGKYNYFPAGGGDWQIKQGGPIWATRPF